jgi:hypothetical protein
MKSWDAYYEGFKGKLALNHRLNIYLKESDQVIKEIERLGYGLSTYEENNPSFELYLPCGTYCFTTTFECDDEEEIEVDVIEIQHTPVLGSLALTPVGLVFMEETCDEEISELAAEWFGLSASSIHSICMFEGYRFTDDQKLFSSQ